MFDQPVASSFYLFPDIDDCSSITCVNGRCVDEVDGYFCSCDVGFVGEFCDEPFQPCRNNATLTFDSEGYTCHCTGGYMGENCTISK